MRQRFLLITVLLALGAPALPVFAQDAAAEGSRTEAPGRGDEKPAGNENAPPTSVWRYFAAALAVGISCVAGGLAVGQIGAAAMGAMSENPELSGKALPYAGLAEGICLWGFLIAFFILQT